MFPAWRLQLRQARLAVAEGRWDEAAALLAHDSLREFRPAKQLSQNLASQLVERARQRIENGHSSAGWKDLNQAARLGAGEAAISDFRRRQTELQLDRVIELLARGETALALQELERMSARNLGGNERRAWKMVAQQLETADLRAVRGDAPAAVAALEHAQRLLPSEGASMVANHVSSRLSDVRSRTGKLQALDARLHAALASNDWTEALAASEALLELAPQHPAARQARHLAWQQVGMKVTQAYRGRPPMLAGDRGRRIDVGNPSPSPSLRGRGIGMNSHREPGKRIVAWIDSVGAYLVCLGEEIVLGQPSPEGGVDVPILADLSRRHAIIRRDGEAYVLSPLHRVSVDGREVSEATVLRDKCTIKLGDCVELRFRKPHALSATAVLDVLSHHRTEPAVKSVVLMSESCILGPQSHAHVQCRQWSGDLVLFRRGDELMCRTQLPVEIDGQTCVGHAVIGDNARIESEEFALSLEQI